MSWNRPGSSRNWHDWAVCLSLANLLFLRIWAETPPFLTNWNLALMGRPIPATHYWALVLNIASLALACRICIEALRRMKNPWRGLLTRSGILVTVVIVGSGLQYVCSRADIPWADWPFWQRALGPRPATLTASTVILVTLTAVGALPTRAITTYRHILLILTPLFFISLGSAILFLGTSHSGAQPPDSIAGHLPERRLNHRVVVLMFDELDYRLAFEQRPEGLTLPAFDRLRAESFFATNARPTANVTALAVPSLTVGQPVSSIRAAESGEFLLNIKGTEVNWAETANLFSTGRRLGGSVAIAGWYFPYCQIFSSALSACTAWPAEHVGPPVSNNLPRTMKNQLELLPARAMPYLGLTSLLSREAIRARVQISTRTAELAAEPQYDLVFAHLPHTHAPYLYDQGTRTFSRTRNTIAGYVDALALADSTLQLILNSLDQSSISGMTSLIVLSDHCFRFADALGGKLDTRVPFAIRLPQDRRSSLEWPHPLSPTLLPDIVFTLLTQDSPTTTTIKELITVGGINATSSHIFSQKH